MSSTPNGAGPAPSLAPPLQSRLGRALAGAHFTLSGQCDLGQVRMSFPDRLRVAALELELAADVLMLAGPTPARSACGQAGNAAAAAVATLAHGHEAIKRAGDPAALEAVLPGLVHACAVQMQAAVRAYRAWLAVEPAPLCGVCYGAGEVSLSKFANPEPCPGCKGGT